MFVRAWPCTCQLSTSMENSKMAVLRMSRNQSRSVARSCANDVGHEAAVGEHQHPVSVAVVADDAVHDALSAGGPLDVRLRAVDEVEVASLAELPGDVREPLLHLGVGQAGEHADVALDQVVPRLDGAGPAGRRSPGGLESPAERAAVDVGGRVALTLQPRTEAVSLQAAGWGQREVGPALPALLRVRRALGVADDPQVQCALRAARPRRKRTCRPSSRTPPSLCHPIAS